MQYRKRDALIPAAVCCLASRTPGALSSVYRFAMFKRWRQSSILSPTKSSKNSVKSMKFKSFRCRSTVDTSADSTGLAWQPASSAFRQGATDVQKVTLSAASGQLLVAELGLIVDRRSAAHWERWRALPQRQRRATCRYTALALS